MNDKLTDLEANALRWWKFPPDFRASYLRGLCQVAEQSKHRDWNDLIFLRDIAILLNKSGD